MYGKLCANMKISKRIDCPLKIGIVSCYNYDAF